MYIMGHSNIAMTLNYYVHATFASTRSVDRGIIKKLISEIKC